MEIPKISAVFFCESDDLEKGNKLMKLLRKILELSEDEELIKNIETLVENYKNKNTHSSK